MVGVCRQSSVYESSSSVFEITVIMSDNLENLFMLFGHLYISREMSVLTFPYFYIELF